MVVLVEVVDVVVVELVVELVELVAADPVDDVVGAVVEVGSSSDAPELVHAVSTKTIAARAAVARLNRRVRLRDMDDPKPALPGGQSLSELSKAYLVRGLIAGVVVGVMLGLLNAISAGATTDASLLSLIGRFLWTLLWSVAGGALGGITLTAVLNGLRRAVSSDRWNSAMVRSMGAVSGVLMGLIFARSLFLAAVAGLAGYLWSWPIPGSAEALEAGI